MSVLAEIRHEQVEGQSGTRIILEHFRHAYKPRYRRANVVCCGDGGEVRQQEATTTPTSALITALASAVNAPKDSEGRVRYESLPGFFRKWAPVAWGDLLTGLLDEDQAEIGKNEPAAEVFRQLVREAMLSAIVLGTVIRGRTAANEVTQTERRSLIGWCQKLAKSGRWQGIRDYLCWVKEKPNEDGEIILMVAIRHELFAQLKADRRLSEMGANKFTRRCERYGVGRPDLNNRPHGKWAVVLDQAIVSDLLAGIPDDPEEAQEPDAEPSTIPMIPAGCDEDSLAALKG